MIQLDTIGIFWYNGIPVRQMKRKINSSLRVLDFLSIDYDYNRAADPDPRLTESGYDLKKIYLLIWIS